MPLLANGVYFSMAKYLLKQKFLSISEQFDVYDADDTAVASVNGTFFSIGKKFTFTNLITEQVTKIRQKVFSLRPTFYIQLAPENSAKVIKTFFPLLKSRFILTHKKREIIITGNFLSHEYNFIEKQNVVAKVSKKWFSFKDSYGVEIEHEDDTELLLSTVIVIDAIHHGSGQE